MGVAEKPAALVETHLETADASQVLAKVDYKDRRATITAARGLDG